MLQLPLDLLVFIAAPLIAILIDGLIALRARGYSGSLSGNSVDDFTIVVPIYGNTRYLENIDYLATYGDKVTLCTTGDESETFYQSLQQIADSHNFRVFRDAPSAPSVHGVTAAARSTSGPIRDRLIRNVLKDDVHSQYVIPLDADTFTSQPMSLLVGELAYKHYDIASIKVVLTNRSESLLTHLQYHEYHIGMAMRFIFPWLISGACHVATTQVLRDIMNRHSLFFQGNDVEVGIIARARNYVVGHIPFEVSTAAPATSRAWFRQRLAWAGGEFRLFIPNCVFVVQHPYLWVYGGLVVIVLFPLRWFALSQPSVTLALVLGVYYVLVLVLHWKTRDGWLLLMPFYCLFLSVIMTPLGIVWYFVMVARDRNYGLIAPDRKPLGSPRAASGPAA